MSAKIFNQKGFTVLETILIAVVMAMIVGTGVYVWSMRQQEKTETVDTTANDASKSKEDEGLASAQKLVKDFYAELLLLVARDMTSSPDEVTNKYTSSAFKESIQSEVGPSSIYFCAQNVPNVVKIESAVKQKDGSFLVRAIGDYSEGEDVSISVVVDSSASKIDAINCAIQ